MNKWKPCWSLSLPVSLSDEHLLSATAVQLTFPTLPEIYCNKFSPAFFPASFSRDYQLFRQVCRAPKNQLKFGQTFDPFFESGAPPKIPSEVRKFFRTC